ncbi:MAG: DUF1127 domain-containing protein [Alkalilacustris sp.]
MTDELGYAGLKSGAATIWQGLRDRFHKRRLYTTTLRRLRLMTDAELDELGISRGMISRVAFETAYGRKV